MSLSRDNAILILLKFKIIVCNETSNDLIFYTVRFKTIHDKMCREHFDSVLPSLQLDRRRRSFVGSPVTTNLIKFVFA